MGQEKYSASFLCKTLSKVFNVKIIYYDIFQEI